MSFGCSICQGDCREPTAHFPPKTGADYTREYLHKEGLREWFLEPDTVSAAKMMLAAYEAGFAIRCTEGWALRFAQEAISNGENVALLKDALGYVEEGWLKERIRAAIAKTENSDG